MLKIVLVLAVIGLTVGKPTPQQGATATGSGPPPKRKLWLKLDGDSMEVFDQRTSFKSNMVYNKNDPIFYYDNSGELKMVPDPAMFSQVYSKFYSNLPMQGHNAPRYYIDSSGEVGIASDRFMTQVFRENNNSNLYRDTSGELLYVYPQGYGPGSSPSVSPVRSPAVARA